MIENMPVRITPDNDEDDAETRVARFSRCSRDEAREVLAETVLAPVSREERHRSAEFLPPSGQRSTGEVTAPWAPGRRAGPPRKAGMVSRALAWLRKRRHRAPLIAALTLCVACAAVFLARRASGTAPSDHAPRLTVSGSTATVPVEPAAIPSPDGGPSDHMAPAEVALRRAVDAVAAGRVSEAARLYDDLARRHPEDRSLLAARDILLRAGGKP